MFKKVLFFFNFFVDFDPVVFAVVSTHQSTWHCLPFVNLSSSLDRGSPALNYISYIQ